MIINNTSNVTFDYVLPDQKTMSGEQESNLVQTEVLTSSVSRVKSSDKFFLNEGETAKQNIVVTNNSGAILSSMFFRDTISSGATHVPGKRCCQWCIAAFL